MIFSETEKNLIKEPVINEVSKSIDVALKSIEIELQKKYDLMKKIEEEINKREKEIQRREEEAKQFVANMKDKVKLNIGGMRFETTKITLLAEEDTFFYNMIWSGRWLPDEDGEYFIDRDPKYFIHLLNYHYP